MYIHISQKEISFGQKYLVSINNKAKYLIDSPVAEIFDDYFVKNLKDDEIILTVHEKPRLINAKYRITNRLTNIDYDFSTKSYWLNSYFCLSSNSSDNNKYEFFEHPKLRFTIYKNDYLIAYGRRDRFTAFQGDEYYFKLTDNEDYLLLVGMIICIDDYKGSNNKVTSLLNYNYGVVNQEIKYTEDL